MEVLAPAAVGAFVAVPAILALYVLKVRGARTNVGSLVLWPVHLADRQANAPWKRLRSSWLLMAQLLVAAIVALALMRPGLVGAAGSAGTTVVLIDGSASMRATDVAPSRFESAVSRARGMADGLGSGRQMAVVVLGSHAELLASPTSDPAVLDSALDRARPSGEAANLGEGLSVANALLAGSQGGAAVLLSDGHFRPPLSTPNLSAPLRYERIGTSGENVALESLGRSPAGDVFVRVANLGSSARDLRVEMRADGRLVDLVPVRVEGGSAAEASWPRLPEGTAVLEARLTPGDEFALDDSAWLLAEAPTARRVLVVRNGGEGFLTRALGVRDDLELTVVEPGAYQPGPYDLYVFDGFVPEGPLPGPSLVVDPPEGKGPVPAGPQVDPGGVLPANPREPLLAYVSLRDIHVQSAAITNPPAGWRTVIAGAGGPLLLVNQGEPRSAQLNFDIHRSDLPLRNAFPILVQNLVSHLMPGGLAGQVLPLGRPARLEAGPGASAMEVTTPGGRRALLRPPFPASLEDTDQPGVYTVRTSVAGQGPEASRFIVALADPGQSRIAPGEAPAVRVLGGASADAPKATLELWPWFAGALFVFLLVEWVVFLRG